MAADSSSNVVAFGAEKMIYDSVQRFTVINLNDLIRVLMENVDDSLFELSDKAKSDQDRNMFFEAMREIRLKREQIQESFDSALQFKFSQLLKTLKSVKTVTAIDELSLIAQDEFEDKLAIDNMISKARPHFEDELLAISARMRAILKRKEIANDDNPLDPKSICDSFHEASKTLNLDIEVKLIFYKLFDKYVISNLGFFYKELNELFIKKGVLVDFSAEQERANQTTQFMANRIRSNDHAEAEKQEITNSLLQQKVESETINTTAPKGSLLALLQQMLMPASSTVANVQNDIPLVDMNLSTGAKPSIGSSNLVGLSPAAQDNAYIAALTQLQGANLPSSNASLSDSPEIVKSQLQQQIVAFKQENSERSSAIDNQVIDIVSMIFDFFFEDDALPSPIKVLIGRLQIPILKVAIIDNSFFNSKKHPARALLDLISKESIAWNREQESQLVGKVEALVETILTDFDQDMSVFETALDDFQQFIDDQEGTSNERVESVINQEQENDEHIQQAQHQAQVFVSKLIEAHELSFDMVDFLDGQWKSVLYLTFLSQGYDSNYAKKLRHITHTLIWSLIAKHTDDEKRKLFKTLPALLRAMSKAMQLVKIAEETQNSIFKMLVKEHATVVKVSNQHIVTRVNDTTVWPQNDSAEAFEQFNKRLRERESTDITLYDLGAEQAEENSLQAIHVADTQQVIHNLDEFTHGIETGDIQIDDEIIMESSPNLSSEIESNAEQDDFLEKAQALEIGSWVEFIGEQKGKIKGKLSWKSNVTGKYVFVDKQGKKIKKMTSFGLSVELRSGNACLLQSTSVFDRAIGSLMNTIRH